MSLVECVFCKELFDPGERHLCEHANGKLLELYRCNPNFNTITVKQNGMIQSTSIFKKNSNNANHISTDEINQNSIFALPTSTSGKESIGKPQIVSSNQTRAEEVTNETTMIPNLEYEEEFVSEIVNSQSFSIQHEGFSVNYDEEIFGDAEEVKKILWDMCQSDNSPQEHNRVSNIQNYPSTLKINQSFERLGNEIGFEYNETAFPNYKETAVAGIRMNIINPLSMCAQNDQNMFGNEELCNTTPILPIQENEPNCIFWNSSLHSVQTDPTLNISSLRNQAGYPETEEGKQVPAYETTTNGNKSTANNKILLKGEVYFPEQSFYKPRKSYSTEHFPLFNDSAILGCFGTQVKECKFPTGIDIHSEMHPSETQFTCQICQKPFLIEANLKDHMLIHSEDRRHSCGQCGKLIARKEDVKTHTCIHARNVRYKCDYCEKSFKSNSDLQRHIRTHTGEKPYECEHCKRTFSLKQSLQVHIRTHTGEKPYKCEYCEKTFRYQTKKQEHIRTHTGEKPYECLYCEKTFRRKYHKQEHIRTHTGEKPYKCRICERAFARKQHLKVHKCIQIGG